LPFVVRLVLLDRGDDLGDRASGLLDGGPGHLDPRPSRFDLFLEGLYIAPRLVELRARLIQAGLERARVNLEEQLPGLDELIGPDRQVDDRTGDA